MLRVCFFIKDVTILHKQDKMINCEMKKLIASQIFISIHQKKIWQLKEIKDTLIVPRLFTFLILLLQKRCACESR